MLTLLNFISNTCRHLRLNNAAVWFRGHCNRIEDERAELAEMRAEDLQHFVP